ncbi:MAG: hypothetical protein AAF810_26265 [Cyanobacteria bacterium P01_D01_bin.36]
MQIFQDTKSSGTPNPSTGSTTPPFQMNLPAQPDDHDVMCLVFADGSVRTVKPQKQNT